VIGDRTGASSAATAGACRRSSCGVLCDQQEPRLGACLRDVAVLGDAAAER
jgi:hypothetical protein